VLDEAAHAACAVIRSLAAADTARCGRRMRGGSASLLWKDLVRMDCGEAFPRKIFVEAMVGTGPRRGDRQMASESPLLYRCDAGTGARIVAAHLHLRRYGSRRRACPRSAGGPRRKPGL